MTCLFKCVRPWRKVEKFKAISAITRQNSLKKRLRNLNIGHNKAEFSQVQRSWRCYHLHRSTNYLNHRVASTSCKFFWSPLWFSKRLPYAYQSHHLFIGNMFSARAWTLAQVDVHYRESEWQLAKRWQEDPNPIFARLYPGGFKSRTFKIKSIKV